MQLGGLGGRRHDVLKDMQRMVSRQEWKQQRMLWKCDSFFRMKKKTVMKSHVSHCGRFLKQVSIWKQTRQPHNFGSWAEHDQRYIFRSTSKTEKQPLRRFYLLFDWSWTFLITTTTPEVTSWIYVMLQR